MFRCSWMKKVGEKGRERIGKQQKTKKSKVSTRIDTDETASSRQSSCTRYSGTTKHDSTRRQQQQQQQQQQRQQCQSRATTQPKHDPRTFRTEPEQSKVKGKSGKHLQEKAVSLKIESNPHRDVLVRFLFQARERKREGSTRMTTDDEGSQYEDD